MYQASGEKVHLQNEKENDEYNVSMIAQDMLPVSQCRLQGSSSTTDLMAI